MKATLLANLNITKENGVFNVIVRTEEMKRYIESISEGNPVVVTLKPPRKYLGTPEHILEHFKQANPLVDVLIKELGLKIETN